MFKDGFATRLIRLHIKLENNESFPAVLKLPKFTPKNLSLEQDKSVTTSDEEKLRILSYHNNECTFYHHFSDKHVLPLPRVYYKELCRQGENGMIVMEDLSVDGFVQPLYEGLNVEQVSPSSG